MPPARQLRIAYLYQTPSPGLDKHRAASVHIFHIVRALQRRSHQVRLMTLRGRFPIDTDAPEALLNGDLDRFQYTPLGVSGRRPFLWIESGLRRFQRELRLPYLGLFDSFHFYEACRPALVGHDVLHERYNLLALGGTWTARATGIPLVLEVNGDMLAELDYLGQPLRGLRRRVAIWSNRLVFSTAQAIISPSRGLANHLVAQWGVQAEKMFAVPNAADVETFGAPADPASRGARLGLPNGAPVVMFVGGFYRWHGLEMLLEAFARTCQEVPTAHLVLVGDGEARPAVEARISTLNLRGSVALTGSVPHTEVPSLLALANVAVATLHEKGWGLAPLKLFEYMAAGKAIVASAAAGINEFLTDGETGILVPPGDVEALAQALVYLLYNPAEQSRLGLNARRQAVEQHSWQHYAEQLEDIYADILETG